MKIRLHIRINGSTNCSLYISSNGNSIDFNISKLSTYYRYDSDTDYYNKRELTITEYRKIIKTHFKYYLIMEKYHETIDSIFEGCKHYE